MTGKGDSYIPLYIKELNSQFNQKPGHKGGLITKLFLRLYYQHAIKPFSVFVDLSWIFPLGIHKMSIESQSSPILSRWSCGMASSLSKSNKSKFNEFFVYFVLSISPILIWRRITLLNGEIRNVELEHCCSFCLRIGPSKFRHCSEKIITTNCNLKPKPRFSYPISSKRGVL